MVAFHTSEFADGKGLYHRIIRKVEVTKLCENVHACFVLSSGLHVQRITEDEPYEFLSIEESYALLL